METNEKIKKNGMLKVIILVILIIAVVILAGFAYARYMTTKSGQAEVEIAKWNFNVTAGSSQTLSIDLADTRLANDTTEVDRTKVAPGTKGALALNINATGTQVSLEYDIDIGLTRIPENLIFYSDSNMTNAILKENGKIHLDGFFGANDTNKTATKNLYWQWKLETGTTQAEIDSNDLLDSEWMGDEIILDIQATGRQVMENPSTEYTVTFDLNGGKLANHGDSTQVTKQVKYGEAYGTLPTPTREGYTFAGWNGKNLFNCKNGYYANLNGVSGEIRDDKFLVYGINTSNRAYGLIFQFGAENGRIKEVIKKGTSYTVSINGQFKDQIYVQLNCKDNNNTERSLFSLSSNTGKKISFVVPDDYNSLYYFFVGIPGVATEINSEFSVQIEEGNEATDYEPYYITSSTEVVQNQNHTLTAIWVEN